MIVRLKDWLRLSCAVETDAPTESAEGSTALTIIPEPVMLPALVVAVGVNVYVPADPADTVNVLVVPAVNPLYWLLCDDGGSETV